MPHLARHISEVPDNKIDIAIKQCLARQYAEVLSDWLKNGDNGVLSRISTEPVSMNTPSWHQSMLAEPFPDDLAYIACLKRRVQTPTLKFEPTNEHWIALIGNEGENLAVACSYTSHHVGDDYTQWCISVGEQNRKFNNLIAQTLTRDHVYVGSRYRVVIS